MGKSEKFLVLDRVYLGPLETFTPPPHFKVVPAPLILSLVTRHCIAWGRAHFLFLFDLSLPFGETP